jgi:hypothetical protein
LDSVNLESTAFKLASTKIPYYIRSLYYIIWGGRIGKTGGERGAESIKTPSI